MPSPKAPLSDDEKRRRHSEAQRKYLLNPGHSGTPRPPGSKRDNGCSGMKRVLGCVYGPPNRYRLRAGLRTPEQKDAMAEKRREGDADYRQLTYVRHRKRNEKFVAKFGYATFIDLYYPQFEIYGKKHLPGLRLDKLATESTEYHLPIVGLIGVANYEDDDEHDGNPRKFWFVILGEGLFTLNCRSDADLVANADSILMFFTRHQATKSWRAYCNQSHLDGHHSAQAPPPPAPRASSFAARGQSAPAARSSSRLPVHSGVKPPISVKKAQRRKTMPKKEEDDTKYVPLFDDDTPPQSPTPKYAPLYDDDMPPQSPAPTVEHIPAPPAERKRSVCAMSSMPPQLGSRRTRPRPSPPSLGRSPSISSISSLSSMSATTADVAMSSVSMVGRGRAFKTTPGPLPQSPAPPVRKHFKKSLAPSAVERARMEAESISASAARAALAADYTAARELAAQEAQSPSARLLFNKTTRTFYEDAEMAFREMAKRETVQVVDCEDVVEFCARLDRKTGQ
ncbi:hypothetical protein B0H15DRAFT_807008 [Mycena belliarum]|uniref:Uncharacterized protein n=1 Tax=Mycena belliarum TaxID=1033014 RepID=A0AAD6XIB5_9AGAR|nr:hypothetical protein B0H15DRAFT_807008 [Mycena belliae]